MNEFEFTELALELADRIKPILAGHGRHVQAAALAELTSIWLAGHCVPGDPEATRKVRAEFLEQYCALVRELADVNARMMGVT